MYDGRTSTTVSPDIAREEIGLLMAGATPEPAGGQHMSTQAPDLPPGAAPEAGEPAARPTSATRTRGCRPSRSPQARS